MIPLLLNIFRHQILSAQLLPVPEVIKSLPLF